MAGKAKSSVARHRARRQLQGLVRVEVNVRKEDASLVRLVASALSDPSRQVGHAIFFGNVLPSRPR
jgi:hypothetical protein